MYIGVRLGDRVAPEKKHSELLSPRFFIRISQWKGNQNMSFEPVPKVARRHGVSPEQIHSVRLTGDIPKWMEKRGKNWVVDETNPSFKIFLQSKIRRANSTKLGITKRRKKKAIAEQGLELLDEAKTKQLQELSIQADLSQSIVKLRLENYKIEKQKVELQKSAGELIERGLAQFLYIGYLDRLNRENLQYQNKIESNVEQLISSRVLHIKKGEEVDPKAIAKEIVKLITKEQEEIIRNVKKGQQQALEDWAKENGITL